MPTDHPEYLAFLRAVCACPADDTARLVFADWLDEHGRGDRAEFIRVQIAVARRSCPACGGTGGLAVEGMRARMACPDCVGREHRLLADHGRAWRAGVLPGWRAVSLMFRRGFVDSLTLSAADWLAHADALVWRPGVTDPCPRCGGACRHKVYRGEPSQGWDWQACRHCRTTGSFPRPCPPTAQPITRVGLTTIPGELHRLNDRGIQTLPFWGIPGGWTADGTGEAVSPGEAAGRIKRLAEERWPGITFTLPDPA